MWTITKHYPILPANKGKTFSHFQQKMLQLRNNTLFNFGFAQRMRFRYLQKIKNIRLANNVDRIFYDLSFLCKFENAFCGFGSRKTKIEGGSFLP